MLLLATEGCEEPYRVAGLLLRSTGGLTFYVKNSLLCWVGIWLFFVVRWLARVCSRILLTGHALRQCFVLLKAIHRTGIELINSSITRPSSIVLISL